MNIVIRNEQVEDYRRTEEVAREGKEVWLKGHAPCSVEEEGYRKEGGKACAFKGDKVFDRMRMEYIASCL